MNISKTFTLSEREREVKVNRDIGSKKSRGLGLETKNDLLRIL